MTQTVKVFDFNVLKKQHKECQKGYQRVEIRSLSMRDDKFLIDYVEYDEKLTPQDPVLNHKKAAPPKNMYDYKNMVKFSCIFSAIRASCAN